MRISVLNRAAARQPPVGFRAARGEGEERTAAGGKRELVAMIAFGAKSQQ
jgi:hypothetical protein